MKWIHYSRYTGDDFGISAEDLLKALSEFFLQSGFGSEYMQFSEWNRQTLEDLKNAIERALQEGRLFETDQAQQMADRLGQMSSEEIDQLLERLVQKLADEGYVTVQPETGPGQGGQTPREIQVEITDKSIDFFGFKTLKDLLAGLGKSSFGAHDTRDMATGVEASGAAKLYEFGDTLNLDVSTTLFSAMQREGVKLPLDLEYSDLHVHQSEYQSSC
ncbi:MAG TPA: hypothetical protein VMZ52_18870, partial [Bryobacteraceae bacterium]|nr:hypothetical protein [Bryobacteraceae bacterium]